MALTVEDGTGLANADSFVSLADAETHFTAVGSVLWTGEDADKEAALRRASSYLSSAFKFVGSPTNGRTQALCYPRTGVSDRNGDVIASDEVPREIVQATLWAAEAELQTPGVLTPTVTPGRVVQKEKIDVIEQAFFSPAQQPGKLSPTSVVESQRPVLTKIRDALRGLIVDPDLSIPHPFVG